MEIARGFFEGRRPLKLRSLGGGRVKNFAEYLNVPASIGRVISSRLATLNELETVYSTEDLYNMLEIITVDDYNSALMNQVN